MFTEQLKKVVDNVDGGVAGVIMGLDGIAVETYVRDGHTADINTIGMEFSFILTQVKKAAEILEVVRIARSNDPQQALLSAATANRHDQAGPFGHLGP